MSEGDKPKSSRGPSGLAVALGMVGLVGLLAASITLLLLPIVLIFKFDWPWFGPEPSLRFATDASSNRTFLGAIAGLMLAFGIRSTRRSKMGLPVGAPFVGAIVGTLGWALHSYTALGTASYFISRWIIERGPVVAVVYGALAFFGGLSPGFLGAQSLLIFAVYRDPRLLTYVVIPAVIGEIIDSLLGDVREKSEKQEEDEPSEAA